MTQPTTIDTEPHPCHCPRHRAAEIAERLAQREALEALKAMEPR